MHTHDHVCIGAAAKIPINTATPVLSLSPVVLRSPDRPVDLDVKVTVPATGSKLPIILFSHGQGRSNWLSSLEGYTPLVEFWAAHGFAVLQPTHLRSSFLGRGDAPRGNEMFWKDGPHDMVRILDSLDQIEQSMPGLTGRLDRERVAMVGHSAGSITAMLLLGAHNTDPRDGTNWSVSEPRIKTGIILGGLGKGSDIHAAGRERLPYFEPDFGTLSKPALVVYGDKDASAHFTERDAAWHADAYHLGPGPKDLLVLKGAWHCLGGISGWDAAENAHQLGDESPEILGFVQRMTWAYLYSQLYGGDKAWGEACKAFDGLGEHGSVEKKE